MAAAGVGGCGSSGKGDAPTIPTLKQLLDEWKRLRYAPF